MTSKNTIKNTLNNTRILYKPGLQLFIVDWLSIHNHEMDRDKEIPGMCITTKAIVMHGYTRLYDGRRKKITILDDEHIGMLSELILYGWEHIGMLSELILYGWPLTKAEVQEDLQPYWSFRDEIAVIDGIAMKDGRMMSAVLQEKALKQPHLNYIGIEKTRLLAHESLYLVNMITNIEVTVKMSIKFQEGSGHL